MIKWGIIGTGHMANIFAQSIQEIDNAKLVAISSRTKKSLKINYTVLIFQTSLNGKL